MQNYDTKCLVCGKPKTKSIQLNLSIYEYSFKVILEFVNNALFDI